MSGFKGSLSNVEATEIVAGTLGRLGITATAFPIGDGGSGTQQAILRRIPGDEVELEASGPLGKPTRAKVLCLPDANAPHSLYFESAQTCGHALVPESERDAMRATSFGLGELMARCLSRWGATVTRIYVGLGDSAISDMGMGMLSGLGFVFEDGAGQKLWGNAHSLRAVKKVISPKKPDLFRLRFTVLCDVLNPLCGPEGSARTFSPQKGAGPAQIPLIEQGMENLADVIHRMNGRLIKSQPMTGSAGGLSAAFAAFFQTELVLGAQYLLDWLRFEDELARHRIVITGEGKTDAQTLKGKAPLVCIERARKLGKKAVVLSGSLGEGYGELLKRSEVAGCFETGRDPGPQAALERRVQEVFTDPGFLSRLADPSA